MKKYWIPVVAIGLSTLSAYAAEGQIKREFTVTQIALDTQEAQIAEDDLPNDDINTSINQFQGGDTGK